MSIARSDVMVYAGGREPLESSERTREMMSLEDQVYDCEVLIARAERMGNYDAVRRLTEYETTLRQQFRRARRHNQHSC